ncbi:ACT domain-containing protein [Maricaulis salignorans]|uniref:ACT domain-containing protein n=1 Tax=Maricaulis salignorans TaxID=144026 RepID=UPI003A8FB230
MSNTLNIEIFETEGALVRLIGLIERRGFVISSMAMSAPSNGSARVTVDVAARGGARQIDVLTRQIERLFDVHAVSRTPAAEALDFAAGLAPATASEWRAECPSQP